jgi:hypothetical protein
MTAAYACTMFLDACKVPCFHNRWMSSQTWADIIVMHYSIAPDLQFDGKMLVKGIARNKHLAASMDIAWNNVPHDHCGIFHHELRKDGKSRVHYYYATTIGNAPSSERYWTEEISDGKHVLNIKVTRSNVLQASADVVTVTPAKILKSHKRRCIDISASSSGGLLNGGSESREDFSSPLSSSPLGVVIDAVAPLQSNAEVYWTSTEAKKLFHVMDCEDTALQAIDSQMKLLQSVLVDAKGYWNVITGVDKDEDLTTHQRWLIRIKAQYLYCALAHAKNMMPLHQNWDHCCQKACEHLLLCGITTCGRSRCVRNWYTEFVKHKRSFPVRLPLKHKLPMFLDLNFEEKQKLENYCKEHLHELTVELVSEYIHDTLIPVMVEQKYNILPDKEEYDHGVKTLLFEHGLKKICPSTIYKWLKLLGFRYEPRRKSYYVDGHEKAETVTYRNKYIHHYLQYERRMFRWIQVTADESKNLEAKGLVPTNSGYKYTDEKGNFMVEYHVDCCKDFQEKCDTETQFGGHLSVRNHNPRPLIIFGHDEAIFKQYTLTKSAWVAPDGTKVLVPKDEGQGLMISAFQSREYGFGLTMTNEDLQKVNHARRGKKYADEVAAISKRGSANKKDLTNSPFVLEFEYGTNYEGYWSYEHMVLQMEDCVDCLKVIAPQYDYLFLFDHSCGHDKQKEDGLNVEKMSKSYGGRQPKMHDSIIKEVNGYLGPYPKILEPGDVQSFVFNESDHGPFWLSEQERHQLKHDRVQEGITTKRKLRKEELVKKLASEGIVASGRYSSIAKMATERNIAIFEEDLPKIIEGWIGKPKGIYQVLWERGWLDPNNLHKYTLNGQKDRYGVVQPESSLKHILRSCRDFQEEESLLQFMGRKVGVLVDRTPKCHCELAGEGIEYSWGCAKNYYRNLPIKDKKSKELFKESVRKCLDNSMVLNIERIRSFSRRARQYTIAYYTLQLQQNERQEQQQHETFLANGDTQLSSAKIESMVKDFKTHRCALDFDSAFIKSVITKKEIADDG